MVALAQQGQHRACPVVISSSWSQVGERRRALRTPVSAAIDFSIWSLQLPMHHGTLRQSRGDRAEERKESTGAPSTR